MVYHYEGTLEPNPIFSASYPKDVIQSIDFTLIRGSRTILPGIEIMPAPGHTPGVQAVIAPGLHSDLFQAYRSMNKILRMADIIIPMHDPDMALRERIPD